VDDGGVRFDGALTKEVNVMTREEALQWLCEKLGIQDYRNLESGAIHRLEWIVLEATHFRKWSLDDIEEALQATEGQPVPQRIYDIHRYLTFRLQR